MYVQLSVCLSLCLCPCIYSIIKQLSEQGKTLNCNAEQIEQEKERSEKTAAVDSAKQTDQDWVTETESYKFSHCRDQTSLRSPSSSSY